MDTLYPAPRDAAEPSASRAAPRVGSLRAVGVIGIVSALTPEMADRVKDRARHPAAGLAEAARILTIACAIGLILLSRSLARRRRRAWQLAILVSRFGCRRIWRRASTSRRSTISLLLLVALVRWRRRFDVPGDPASVRPLLGLAARPRAASRPSRSAWSPWRSSCRIAPDERCSASASSSASAPSTTGCGRSARPSRRRSGNGAMARALVGRLRQRQPLVLRAATRQELSLLTVAQRVPGLPRRGRTALVSGDPVGDEAEIDELLAELRRIVHAHGWRLAVVGASERASRPLSRPRAQGRLDRGGGCPQSARVLARGPRDSQGAPVGLPARARPATRSGSSPRTTSRRRSRPSSRTSRGRGAAASPSVASR